MTTITAERYHEATEWYEGFCTACADFTRDSTEPDAEGYHCPECGGDTVVGAENALLMGLFALQGD
jgi:hypothetical protein